MKLGDLRTQRTSVVGVCQRNLIYCEETHSFIHRLYNAWKQHFPEDHKLAQREAFDVMNFMADEFAQNRPDLEANEKARKAKKAIQKIKESEAASSGSTSSSE